MVLHNDICSIIISIDETYAINSTDNKDYDLVINPQNLKCGDMYRVLSIKIDLPKKTIAVALVGDFYINDIDCAILEETVLTVLLDDAIVQLDVNNGFILSFKKLDCFGCNFGIYKVETGYIIYGEIEITMLDFNLDKKWIFSGRDIFASVSGKESFKLCESSIQLYDFEDNFYEIDFTGKLIREVSC